MQNYDLEFQEWYKIVPNEFVRRHQNSLWRMNRNSNVLL